MTMDTIILVPLISAIGLLYWSSQLDGDDYAILKLLFQFLFIPLVWISIHFAIIDVSINYASNVDLINLLSEFTYYLGWVVFIIGVYYAFIVFKQVYNIILSRKKAREEERHGA